MGETMRDHSFNNLQGLECCLDILENVSWEDNSDDNDKKEMYLPSHSQPAPPVEKEDMSLVPPEVLSWKVLSKQPCYQEDLIEEAIDLYLEPEPSELAEDQELVELTMWNSRFSQADKFSQGLRGSALLKFIARAVT